MPGDATPFLQALACALDRALVHGIVQRPPLIRQRFWASDAFSCRRRVGLQFMETPRDPVPPRTHELWHWGRVIHRAYADRLRATPGIRILGEEQDIALRLPGVAIPLKGRYDLLLEARPADLLAALERAGPGPWPPVYAPLRAHQEPVRIVVDIKSTGSRTLREVAETGARAADRAELTFCLQALGAPLGLILYHDRERCTREILPVLHDEGFYQEAVRWLSRVAAEIEAGRIPDADFDPAVHEVPCGSCPFRTFCATVPNRAPLARAQPSEADVGAAREVLAEAARRLEPIRDALASTIPAAGRVAVDRISAAPVRRPEPEWDHVRLAEILAHYGFADVPPVPEAARQLVRNGHLPASALAAAARPDRADHVVLHL